MFNRRLLAGTAHMLPTVALCICTKAKYKAVKGRETAMIHMI